MDRAKLAALRKKKAENKARDHKEILDSNASIKEAILALHTAINEQQPYDDSKLIEQLKDLKATQTFSEDIKRLEDALKQSSDKEKLDDLIKTVGKINNNDVVDAVNGLIAKLEENDPGQDEKYYRPYRRVIKLGQRLVFDDQPTPKTLGGVSSSSGVQALLQRTTPDGKAIAIVNPDGTPIAGGGGGGGDASAAKQDQQTAVLEQIRGFDIPPYDEIDLGYTGSDLTTVTYMSNSTTVATLTLTYTGSNLTNVVLS